MHGCGLGSSCIVLECKLALLFNNLWPRRGKRLPKTGETDVDEQVSTASRDEENADRGDYGRRLSQHFGRYQCRSSGRNIMRVRV